MREPTEKSRSELPVDRIVYVIVLVVVTFLAASVGGLVGAGATYVFLTKSVPTSVQLAVNPTLSPTTTPQPSVIQVSTSEIETSITKAVEKTQSTVVTVVGVIKGTNSFFGIAPDQQVTGSGVIVSTDGYIITNNHVVEGMDSQTVTLADGTNLKAVVVGTDIYSDLAVLKVEGKLPAAAIIGNSDVLKPGETVIAIGSPLGDFKNTVTVGVVSATNRSIDTGNGYQLVDLIQTDAAINHGNSGGPLINLNGEVIGINTLVVRGTGLSSDIAEGLGFAIPANNAKAVADQIIQKGYFSRPYLGVRTQWITPDIAAFYNLKVQWGAYVSQIDSGSPAISAGLQRGDIITSIGEISLDDTHPYINALFQYKPGDAITLDIVRDGKPMQVTVTLGEIK